MTCAPPRAGKPTHPSIGPLLPGDVVTLKVLTGLAFVVDDQGYADPNKILLARVADGGREHVKLAVGLHEIATVTRPAPLRVAPTEGVEQDWRDEPAPAVSVLDAEAVDLPVIEWATEIDTGRTRSDCGRFEVFPYCEARVGVVTFNAIDHGEADSAFGFPTRAAAQEWCRKQLAMTRAAERLQADIDAVANPDGIDGRAIVDAKPAEPEWKATGPGLLESRCGRFRIVPRVEDIGRRPEHFMAVDTFAEKPDLRFSEHAPLDDIKAWCQNRAKFDVRLGVDGLEFLFLAREEDGSMIPF